MTHSGQGDESRLPAARPAHEGVVLPADGSEPWIPGVSGEQVAPAGGSPWGAPWGPGQGAQPLPQEEVPGAGAYAQPLPPQAAQHPQAAHHPQMPAQAYGQAYGQTYGQPGQYPGAAGAGPDADATQYIAPVPPGAGALPPENPAESTQFLGVRPGAAGDPAGAADATQYLPPVQQQGAPQQQVPTPPPGAPYGIRPGAPGDRQPPAEFDNLFRSEGPAEATQYLPPVQDQGAPQQSYGAPQQQQPYGAPPQQSYGPAQGFTPQQQSYDAPAQSYDSDPAPRRSSRLPLIAAVVVGCAVVGLGASALMFGGGDDDKGENDNTGVAAATSPAPGSSEAADPAKPQAEELDKLLADSNDSRSAVIRSVESIKSCKNLDQAATDLRGAAEQRRGLVTRLGGLSVDKLPDNEALTASLKKAWEASASADDHYAAWAGQVKDKKGCPGGKARNTGQAAQGNRQSGEATKAKREASGLWNKIATKYGLTERRAEQL
ncbi:hypothetical protein [Streptomyces sp. NPDC055709]